MASRETFFTPAPLRLVTSECVEPPPPIIQSCVTHAVSSTSVIPACALGTQRKDDIATFSRAVVDAYFDVVGKGGPEGCQDGTWFAHDARAIGTGFVPVGFLPKSAAG